MVWQQARSHFLAQPFGRLFMGDGEDEGEGDDARAVIFSVEAQGTRQGPIM